MEARTVKEEAMEILETLPDMATWDDLMYRIYVRQTIEAGKRDSDSCKTVDVKTVRARFGLK